jgi:hypothetical protein
MCEARGGGDGGEVEKAAHGEHLEGEAEAEQVCEDGPERRRPMAASRRTSARWPSRSETAGSHARPAAAAVEAAIGSVVRTDSKTYKIR